MIKGMYEDAGYEMPDIVYWNLHSRNDNFPTSVNEMGTALVSGFSPSIMKMLVSAMVCLQHWVASRSFPEAELDSPAPL